VRFGREDFSKKTVREKIIKVMVLMGNSQGLFYYGIT
jgi:hypothetical protein